ncbi:hypothetical protein BACPLE_02882 [Phocaeicola plebeius DSM 17135]|uniref:DUF4493 domain-containing protein n=1 Tax=Phocaeicola plebeius (strain DSM 17135 / JCM 12973 / CCUG 54634 / M2) TaxID=484018 RepID=B5D1N8_PHOPM|nr:hypothetical protein [Phocaeicola plebeius]EDY94481.1 hypothetical protein BACPLE_02882 [Phocaeicola plebeius DSM 17135]
MMCKVKKVSPLWGFLLSFPLWTVSCVDNKYDLDKDIDMTINVGGEYLTIPAGSTDTTFLSKIIEVEEGDMLQPDVTTHVYHLTKKDDISVEPTVVAQVTINGAETSLEKGLAEFSIGDEVEATVDVELDESNSLEAVADDIDEALKELGALEAQTPATMTVTFEFDGGLKFDEVKAKNLKVKFPDFLVFEKGEVEEGNTLTLNETLSTTPRKLNVIGYRFGDKPGEGIPVVDGNISIKKEVFMQGVVQVVNASGSGELKMTMYVTLDEMTVNSVTGVIQPNIEAETTKIELNDLPDFLKDEDTRLDITNPVILLKADNPLETDVEIDAVLTPKKNNVNIEGHEVKIGTGYGQNKVALIPGTNIIALSRTGECSIEGVTENIKVEDINNLLETIPDDIDVNLQPIVRNENYYNAELGKEYDLPASYEVDVPLSFEQGLNIVYNDSVQDLNKDLNDLDKVSLKNAKIMLSVDNAIPLKLQLKAENVQIKDVYGNELTAVKKTMEEDKQYVTESTDGEKPATSELVLSLTSDDTAFLSKIDRICFKITAVPGSATGVPLKDTQWLKVTSVKLSVPGGVNVDLN